MKIIFATSSVLRNTPVAFASLQKYIFSRLPVKPIVVAHFASVGKFAEISNQKLVESWFRSQANDVFIKFEEDPVLPDGLLTMTKNISPYCTRSGMRGNFLQWHSQSKCNQMLNKVIQLHPDVDLVIWARPDLFYFVPLNFLNKRILFFAPHDLHLNGLCDRFNIGPPDLMKLRLGIYDYFLNDWYANSSHKYSKWNPEIVLKDLINAKIPNSAQFTKIAFGKLRDDHVSRPHWDFLNSVRSEMFLNQIIAVPWKFYFNQTFYKFKSFPKENMLGLPISEAIKLYLPVLTCLVFNNFIDRYHSF
jgi:hypothetical protein